MATELDYMENYTSDVLAQAAYVSGAGTINNPKAHWKCNNDAANTTVTDEMGSHNGVMNENTDQVSTDSGKVGKAFNLDGSTNYFSFTEIEFAAAQSFSLCAWVKIDNFDEALAKVFSHQDGSTRNYEVSVKSDQKIFFSNRVAGADTTSSGTIDTGWHHIVCVHNDDTDSNYIYIDGALDKTQGSVGDNGDPTADCRVGCHSDYGQSPTPDFDGCLDDLRCYDFALSLAEVKAIYYGGNGIEVQNPQKDIQCSSEATIYQQGSYSLKALAQATDSLNDTLTRTIGSPIDLSGQTIIKVSARSSRTGSNLKIGIHDSGGVTSEHTINIASADTWQTDSWDISGVADVDKDAIDSIIVTIVNADSDNTFYLDDFWAFDGIWTLTLTENLALLESETVAVSCLFTESLALAEVLTEHALDDDSWEALLSAQLVNKAVIYFEYNDIDYSSYLSNVTTIKRSAELTSGVATTVLSNINQVWNLFLSDKTEIGTVAQVGLKASASTGFSNKTELFTGKVDDISYTDAEASLKLRDKLVSTLQKRLGNGENPTEYLTAQNPADLAWSLLVTEGGLDGTTSTANTDIDYTSWSNWKTDCTTLKYSLEARFTGHYITNALSMIADRTDSYIWIGGDGKFNFKRPIPPFAPGGTLPEYGRDDCLQIDASLTKENLVNSYRCRYGWDLDIEDWDGSYLAEDATSISEYGTYPGVEEDKVVWHADLDSATEHADRVVDKNKTPLSRITITSTLKGIFLSLGDTILITEILKDLNPIYARITDIENIDVTQGLVRFVCRDISDEQIAAFVLDDVYWGILDESYNPMM